MTKIGKIILIEGTDASGKKTQSIELTNRLNSEGIDSERMSFPRYHTPTGRIISQCYLGKKRVPEEGDVAWFGDADSVDSRFRWNAKISKKPRRYCRRNLFICY